MWTNFFRDGGWGMYPVVLWGFLLVASAVLLLLRPERRYFVLVTWLWLVTLGSGVLGTCVGIVKTFRACRELQVDEQLVIALLGCAEALNCTILALMICIFAGLTAAIAAGRAAWFKAPTAG